MQEQNSDNGNETYNSSEQNEESKIPQAQETEELQTKDNDNSSASDSDEDETSSQRFKEGDPIKLIRVRFPGNAKSHPFLVGKRIFQYGQKVLAMSDRGMTVGYINSLPYETTFKKDLLPLKTISKIATDDDIEEQKSYARKENEAEKVCLRLIEKHKLDMNLTHVEFIQFGKKAVFYFTAPARVDFRNLVKDLVGELKMRIELRQISVRDRAAALGAVGVCGMQTCCSSFLKNYGNVSIKMAKNQNLALIPSKINGVCGQIKCCIRYEDDVYSEKREFLPKEGTFIQAQNGDIGKVLKLQILIEQFDMITDKGQIRRYARNQYDEKNYEPPIEWTFPESFRHVVNETSTVIGLGDEEMERLERYKKEFGEDEYAQSDDDSTNEKKLKAKESKQKDNSPSRNNDRRDNRSKRPQRRPQNRGPKENRDNNNSSEKGQATSKSENGPSENKKRPNNRNRNRNRNRNKNNRPKNSENNQSNDTKKKPTE